MSNHTHIVLHVDKALAQSWSMEEVLSRYHQVYQGTVTTQKYMQGVSLSDGEQTLLNALVEKYRCRLYDLSWFMGNLNESIARDANKEDKCTGRFWEGRFKSQALLDEQALLSCMAYVDLNPVRANMAKTPEDSDYTSIQRRTTSLKSQRRQPTSLLPFVGHSRLDMPKGIPFNLIDYCKLVDITGRCIRQDKAGYIDDSQNPILTRLGLGSEQWLTLTTDFEEHFCYAVGSDQLMKTFGRHTGHQRVKGMSQARTLLKCA
jgi:REP element-mobilizing transposase RayT